MSAEASAICSAHTLLYVCFVLDFLLLCSDMHGPSLGLLPSRLVYRTLLPILSESLHVGNAYHVLSAHAYTRACIHDPAPWQTGKPQPSRAKPKA